MFRRVICFLCAGVLVLSMALGVSVQGYAQSNTGTTRVRKTSGKPAPLVSAMALVLGGLGISMLFDKHDHSD